MEGYLQPAEVEECSVRKRNEKAAWHKIILPQCAVLACLPQSPAVSIHCISAFTSKSYFSLLQPRIYPQGCKVLTRHICLYLLFTYMLYILLCDIALLLNDTMNI